MKDWIDVAFLILLLGPELSCQSPARTGTGRLAVSVVLGVGGCMSSLDWLPFPYCEPSKASIAQVR